MFVRLATIDRSQLSGESRTAVLIAVKPDARPGGSAEWPMVHSVVWRTHEPRRRHLPCNSNKAGRFGGAHTEWVAHFRALKRIPDNCRPESLALSSPRALLPIQGIALRMRQGGIIHTRPASHCAQSVVKISRSYRSRSPQSSDEER